MKNSDVKCKQIIEKEINLLIGMKKIQSGASDYIEALKKFLEMDEIHQLRNAIGKEDYITALKRIHNLKIKSLNLGLMNLYELYVEMESVLKYSDLGTMEKLVEEVNERKQNILMAIA